MYTTFKLQMEFKMRVFINGFLYFFRKLPIIRKKSVNHTYRYENLKDLLKQVLPVITILIELLKGIFFMAIFVGVFILIKMALSMEANLPLLAFTAFYLPSAILCYDMEDSKLEILKFYEYFHLDPSVIIKSKIFLESTLRIISRILAFLILGLFLDIPLSYAVFFPIYLFSLELLGNGIFTYRTSIGKYDKTGLKKILLILLAGAFLLFIFLYFNVDVERIFGSPLLISSLIPAYVVGKRLIQYKGYSKDFTTYVLPHADELLAATDAKSVMKTQSSLKDTDLGEIDELAYTKYSGYNLLNHLFFKRHKRLILKPILIKAAIALVLLAGANIVLFVLNYFNIVPISEIANLKDNLQLMLPGLLPFLCYLLLKNDSLTRLMFNNCDQSFLSYGFYKRSPDLLKMFSLRLLKVLNYNALLVFVLVIGMMGLFLQLDIDLIKGLPIFIQVVALGVFFTVHDLFMYYIFQPYTEDLQAKNVFFGLINSLVYLVCFMSMQLDLQGALVGYVFTGAAILYTVVALVLVYKLAPKRFKLHE